VVGLLTLQRGVLASISADTFDSGVSFWISSYPCVVMGSTAHKIRRSGDKWSSQSMNELFKLWHKPNKFSGINVQLISR